MTEATVRSDADHPALRLLRRLIDVSPAELPALGWCWLYIFSVLASYYILRPIRDQMGVAGGVKNLAWLFTGTLVIMVVLNVPFSALVKLLPRKRFISLSYRFFAISILAFGAAIYVATPEQTVWIGRFFFIWISVFNLFVVAIFWSMVVDIFSSEQGKRLFGFIAAGATLGAIVGSSVTATLAQKVQPAFLMIGAALLLEVATWCVRRLSHLSSTHERSSASRGRGGADRRRRAVRLHRRDPLAVSAEHLDLPAPLRGHVDVSLLQPRRASCRRPSRSRAEQTQFFASIELVVNVIALFFQVFLTGRLVRWFGVMAILSLLPVLSVLGFGSIYVAPTLAAVATFYVVRRAGNYALTQPARQTLYTVVSREDRYKTKNFIDTTVYRLGDQIGIWSSTAITYVTGWGHQGKSGSRPSSCPSCG